MDSNEAYWAQGTTVENISYGMKNYTLSIDVAANPGVWQVIVSLAAVVGAFIASIPAATIAIIGAAIVVGGVVIYLGYQAISYLIGQLALEASSGAGVIDYGKDVSDIAEKYGNLECTDAKKAITTFLNKKKQQFEVISIQYPPDRGFVVSISHGGRESISTNGFHVGILYNGKVYCNVHPTGLTLIAWLNDFDGVGYCVVTPSKYQALKIQ